ncbi:hypothetical protein Dimus_013303 [Dionaea muscipula]
MKMSTYSVLDNRPIDQWKVTELREELKRRRLTTKGLKEDLVRRLDEAIRSESESVKEEENNGANYSDPATDTVADESVPMVDDTACLESKSKTTDPQVADDGEDNCSVRNAKMVLQSTDDGVDDGVAQVDEDQCQQEVSFADLHPEGNEVSMINSPAEVADLHPDDGIDNGVVQVDEDQCHQEESFADLHHEGNEVSMINSPAEVGNVISDNMTSRMSLGSRGFQNSEVEKEDKDSGTEHVPDDIRPLHEDEKLNLSDPINQVSEVSASLGFQVNFPSITSDSISINETNYLKDNIIADDVKLELDVKPEMVQPSSTDVVPGAGESHPMDVEEPHEDKVSVEQTYNNVAVMETSKKNDSADLGSSEKLNLDRSSGDDSMEEVASESKQIDSTYKPSEGGEKNEESVIPMVKEDNRVDVIGDDLFVEKKNVHVENKSGIAMPNEKRRLSDHVVEVNEPSKRPRRWNSGKPLNIVEPNSFNISSSTTPKDIPQPASLKRTVSLSNSNADHDAPKERIVPPPTRSPTNSLRIDRFLRPFTLKAVQALLGKTGTVNSFWMDHIKTHCYVTYSSEAEAVKTRNAVYNLQWPPNGGRLLVAEFVEPEEVKLHLEAPAPQRPAPQPPSLQPPAIIPIGTGPAAHVPLAMPQLTSSRLAIKQQQPALQPGHTLPPPPPLPNPAPAREVVLPPPPPLPERIEPSIVTLDDLFRKTKATPRIYYLPLTEEQVSAKLRVEPRMTRQ